MKKKILLTILALSMFLVTACSSKNQEVVNVYNWGEYIDKSLLDKFTKETGIKVVYDTYDDNEKLYTKMKGSGAQYDILVPSDYMIEKMIKEDMLQKIDTSKIPNYKNVGEEFKKKDFDPNDEYSVPYFWGTLGIVYNTKQVSEKIDSWDVLFDEKYKDEIIMMNSSRDGIGIALLKLGYSINSRNPEELDKARELLTKQHSIVKAYLLDETKDMMKHGEAKIAVLYSGDAVDAISENKDLAYVIPKEGSNLWFDSMVIPKGAKNYENALKFINFMLEPENAAQNAGIGFSTPVTPAKDLLPEEVRNDKNSYPDAETIKRLGVFRDPGETVKLYDEIWQKVKGN
ncbi:MAG: spermidine/putrescine ABC transporter substrate-binding protein [Tissierellia bacterium]|nr:spermidine/putrescine ABC transporter substrate-binding protein [Tissierellia bacterium]